MAQTARGTVTERPWGRTLGAIGLRGMSGQLTLAADGKRYCIAFANGAVVAASSPLASDAAVRIALTANLVSSTQVADITRRLAAAPDRDEVELIGELARLAPEQTRRLRRRVIAHRAARTFSVDQGEFVLDSAVALPVQPGSELDVRTIIYLGARGNLSESRLAAELGVFGTWFQLKPGAADDLPQFGFSEADQPIVESLRGGLDRVELEARHHELGERAVRSVVYALASCGLCETRATARASPPQTLAPRTRESSIEPTTLKRGMERPRATGTTGSQPAIQNVTPRVTTIPPPLRAQSEPPARPDDAPSFVRMKPPSSPPKNLEVPTVRVRNERDAAAAADTEALIADRVKALDDRADHFALLGVARTAAREAIQAAYLALARRLHPDRLTSLGVRDEGRDAQRLMAEINRAFAILADDSKRADYLSVLDRGGEAVVRAEDAKATELALKVMRAEEAFKVGEMALRRDQLETALAEFTTAVELQPNEPEYQALLAWVKFAVAPDKKTAAPIARTALQRVADDSGKSVTARFYLGRVERMVNREREALEHFQAVLRARPNHAEASSEVRVLESRLKGKR